MVGRRGENVDDAWKTAFEIVERFNGTLHLYEKARVLLDVVIVDVDARKQHEWEKQNSVTVSSGGRMFDVYKCSVCGVTGKCYGLDGEIERDRKFKPKVYERCDTSLNYLKKKKMQGEPK